jgi:MoxR-like ATPase
MTRIPDQVIDQLGEVIPGKQHQLRLALACLLARGHLLIEDLPGGGKTTLAHALATVPGLRYQRIQFTSDLDSGGPLRFRRFEGGWLANNWRSLRYTPDSLNNSWNQNEQISIPG